MMTPHGGQTRRLPPTTDSRFALSYRAPRGSLVRLFCVPAGGTPPCAAQETELSLDPSRVRELRVDCVGLGCGLLRKVSIVLIVAVAIGHAGQVIAYGAAQADVFGAAAESLRQQLGPAEVALEHRP